MFADSHNDSTTESLVTTTDNIPTFDSEILQEIGEEFDSDDEAPHHEALE
jgi:hypothetical protein